MEPALIPSAQTLVDLMARPENAYIMAAAMSVLAAIHKVLPKSLSEHSIVVRLRPLYPLLLTSALVHLPGIQPSDMATSSKILVGLILGGACGHLYKVWGQTVLGKDDRIKKP